LRGYALSAPPMVLVLPAEAEVQAVPSGMQSSASESQETVFQSDGSGRSVTRTRHCKNGECSERVEVQRTPGASLTGGGSAAMDHPKGSLQRRAAFQEPLSRAVESMAREMRDAERSFGPSGLEGLMRDVFAASRGPSGGWAVRTPAGAAAGTQDNGSMESASSSTEVVVKDGKMVKRVRRCENGKCESSVTEGPAGGMEAAEGRSNTTASGEGASGGATPMPF